MDQDIRDLFDRVVGVLEAFSGDIEQAQEFDIGLPSEVEKLLDEREVLLAVMNAAPEEWKPALRDLYRQNAGASHQWCGEIHAPPVLPEVKADVEAALEDVRRARLVHDELR